MPLKEGIPKYPEKGDLCLDQSDGTRIKKEI
jgi:hypothetical protein